MATKIETGGGYQAGYDDGNAAGYSNGYSAGNSAGYNSGYKAGAASKTLKIYELHWASSPGHSGTSSVLDTGSTKAKVVHYTLVAANSGYTANGGGELQGSYDGASWATIDSCYANHNTAYKVGNRSEFSYRYYKFTAGELSTFWLGQITAVEKLD